MVGSAVLLRGSFLESVGPFDERLFLYYEDIDLSLRGRELGWRYEAVPASMVRHAHSASTVADSDLVRYYNDRNRLLVLARHRGTGAVTRAALRLVRGDRFVRRARSASDVRPRGVRAGARGRRIPCAGLLGLRAEPPGGTRRPASMAMTAGQRALKSSPQTADGDDARACWATRAMSGQWSRPLASDAGPGRGARCRGFVGQGAAT